MPQLVKQLAEQNWWGEIVGPHGSGKSTLLASLLPLLGGSGREVHGIALRDGQRCLPRGFLDEVIGSSPFGRGLG